jgi:hypothetical protein
VAVQAGATTAISAPTISGVMAEPYLPVADAMTTERGCDPLPGPPDRRTRRTGASLPRRRGELPYRLRIDRNARFLTASPTDW